MRRQLTLRRAVVAGVALALAVAVARAEDIQLKDGTAYHGVKILDRTAARIQIQTPFGPVVFALADVKTIDGVAPGAGATNKPVASALFPPGFSPDGLPPVVVPAGANGKSFLLGPGGGSSTYVHRWRMEIFLVGASLAAGAWMLLILWVQRDAQGTPQQVKRANTLVLLLPFIGGVLYFVGSSRGRFLAGSASRSAEAGAGPETGRKGKHWLFGLRPSTARGLRTREQQLELRFLDARGQPIPVKKDLPGMSGVESARDLLAEAILDRASDIHIEPRDTGWRIRFRVDGVLQERLLFEKVDTLRMVAALKTLAEIDVAEKRKAQDGRFRVATATGEVDFRVATASSIHGEKMVLRLLDRKTGLPGLSDLGMSAPMLAEFNRVIHSRNGMILATGPTGSGKTSTLYAALNKLDAKRLNIMSIEDPVEYEVDGATQIAVNARAGVTYESGLRSILRQDPDVIFVGEMRDKEAATIAIRAALTGHLVFTSLHTKSAVTTIARLVELGIERYQLSSALLMVVAQRLVRVVCPRCREPYQSTGTELEELGIKMPAERLIYRAAGCDVCEETGYQGRTGIFELLVLDDELRRALHDGADEMTLLSLAERKGLRSLREDGVDKILRGLTTVDEVMQAG